MNPGIRTPRPKRENPAKYPLPRPDQTRNHRSHSLVYSSLSQSSSVSRLPSLPTLCKRQPENTPSTPSDPAHRRSLKNSSSTFISTYNHAPFLPTLLVLFHTTSIASKHSDHAHYQHHILNYTNAYKMAACAYRNGDTVSPPRSASSEYRHRLTLSSPLIAERSDVR